jgi:hypothetical protein
MSKTPSQHTTEIKAKNLTKDDRDFINKHSDELSSSTKRAKWIHSPEEHQDHKGQSLATRNPDVVKAWAAERKAVPATVPGTEHGDHLGVLRFNFPGYGGQTLQEVSWDQWMKTFSDRQLVFVYQENKKDGSTSNFFRFDSPLREDA